MAVHSLTLAALATSAVPGLEVTGYSQVTKSATGRVSSLLDSSEGIIRVAYSETSAAESNLSREILCLSALTQGARGLLSFDAPRVLGIVAFKDSRAFVTTNPIGKPLALLPDFSAKLAVEIASCVSEVHELPVQVVKAEGLPVFSATELRSNLLQKLAEAVETGLVPEVLNERWKSKISDDSLWDFVPTVVHGSVDEDAFLVNEGSIAGILGWSELQVSDPALDFVWLSGSPMQSIIVEHYLNRFKSIDYAAFRKRLSFWQEFETVNWLLHGTMLRDNDIKHDAVVFFDRLVDAIKHNRVDEDFRSVPALSIDTVFDDVPEITERSSDTAVIESLEEDKFFNDEQEFADDDQEFADDDRQLASTEEAPAEDLTQHLDDLEADFEILDTEVADPVTRDSVVVDIETKEESGNSSAG